MLGRWNDEGLNVEARRAFALEPPEPVSSPSALPLADARAVLADLRSLVWRQRYYVEDFLGESRSVGPSEYASTPPISQLASWSSAETAEIDRQACPRLSGLLDDLGSDSTLEWLRSLGRPGVETPAIKLRRYSVGDKFASHTDGDLGLGLLLHFSDPPWEEGDGGRMIYEIPGREQVYVPPLFNSVVLLPYSNAATHQVEPVGPSAVRYTIGCDFA